jgi:hypothetical protein
MRDQLRGPSASAADFAARMLLAVARNKEVEHEIRAAILDDISALVSEPIAEREVHFGRLEAYTPPAPTLRDLLLAELSASTGGVA